MKAVVSIHDLMPETMDRVETILHWLDTLSIPPVTLLVVPGKNWTAPQIARLQELAAKGHELAAHGWHHHTTPRKPFHRLHAALISRNVAEHLDLNSAQILQLLQRSGRWFVDNGLVHPELYVPPAWALGRLNPGDRVSAPYRQIETTRGLLIPHTSQRTHLPLTGFEADTPLRERFLRSWNQHQANKAKRSGQPLRISIHPDDLQLRIADQMEALLKEPWHYQAYRDLYPNNSRTPFPNP